MPLPTARDAVRDQQLFAAPVVKAASRYHRTHCGFLHSPERSHAPGPVSVVDTLIPQILRRVHQDLLDSPIVNQWWDSGLRMKSIIVVIWIYAEAESPDEVNRLLEEGRNLAGV